MFDDLRDHGFIGHYRQMYPMNLSKGITNYFDTFVI